MVPEPLGLLIGLLNVAAARCHSQLDVVQAVAASESVARLIIHIFHHVATCQHNAGAATHLSSPRCQNAGIIPGCCSVVLHCLTHRYTVC